MNVIMVHPVHGAKIAMSPVEIEQDEQNGWSRYNSDTPAEPSVEVAPKRKYTRRVVQEQPNSNALVSDESEEP